MSRAVGAAAAFTMTALAACGGPDGASENQVTVSLTPIADLAPYWLGVEQGFYADEGLDVTIQPNQGGAAALPAVMSGKVQFSSANPNTLYVAADQGLAPRILLTSAASTGEESNDVGAVVTTADSTIQDAGDLPGASVAVPTLNSIGDPTIRRSVQNAGGDDGTVDFVEVPFPEMTAALEAGNVDAAFLVEPFLSSWLRSDGRAVVWNYVETADQMPITSLYTSQQVMDDDAELVESFVAATRRSLEYAAENPDEIKSILGTFTELSPEQIAQMTFSRWTSEVDRTGYEALAEQVLTDGSVDRAPDLSALLPAL
ncbi:ABC transporter substrate-binding protein [Aeromicrobium sp. CTD01-1L150]|uniref:ABC transporter substrate-binding protein n=1 Tax=Aeromicrobium sp. CTD01-1L150 TaxID=3341830 RepID=UPI0035BFBE02